MNMTPSKKRKEPMDDERIQRRKSTRSAAHMRRGVVVLIAAAMLFGGVTAPASAATTPVDVTAEGGVEIVHVKWSYSNLIEADTFRIYRNTSGQPEMMAEVSGTVRSFSDTDVTGGVTYRYSVSAVDVLGESSRSAEVSATPSTEISTEVPPDAPRDLTANADFTGTDYTWPTGKWTTVDLRWYEPLAGKPDQYHVYRLSCPFNWPFSQCDDMRETELVARKPGSHTSYSDRVEDLSEGTTHYYWVSAVYSRTEGHWSNEAWVSEPCTWC